MQCDAMQIIFFLLRWCPSKNEIIIKTRKIDQPHQHYEHYGIINLLIFFYDFLFSQLTQLEHTKRRNTFLFSLSL
jgi:hypothetical protein